MPLERIRVAEVIPTTPAKVYAAWIDGKKHAAMTGLKATGKGEVGASFTAGEGYISGRHLELVPDARIVQSWRTTEFPEDASDSRVEILLAEDAEGCRVTVIHSDIPEGQGATYEEGWTKHYFTPMLAHWTKK